MIYKCKKQMYDAIANLVTKKDLTDENGKTKTLEQFMCDYFGRGLNLQDGTITGVLVYY